MTTQEIERFAAERSGAVIGKPIADRMNWNVGERVTMVGGLPPFPRMEFVIVAIPPKLSAPWFYLRLDYYDEVYQRLTGGPVGVHNFWMKCSSPDLSYSSIRRSISPASPSAVRRSPGLVEATACSRRFSAMRASPFA